MHFQYRSSPGSRDSSGFVQIDLSNLTNGLRLILLVTALMPFHATAAQEAVDVHDFDRQVAPILAANCLQCHSTVQREAGLDLSRAAGLAVGGDSGEAIDRENLASSLLWRRIASDEMPPEQPLAEVQRKVIRRWILSGANWGTDPIDPFRFSSSKRAGYDWWSLQPLATNHDTGFQPSPTNRLVNPIDYFIRRRLDEEGIKPTPRARPRTLVRRLYFDLLGLPAPADVVDRFSSDPSRQAWHELVNQFLDSPHYGERWARHWMDVVRFGETNGFEYNEPREHAWHYRDWLIRAFNNDLPYDQFVRMQLAGDIIADDAIEGAAAAGFLVAGVHNTVLGKSEAMKQTARHEELEEIAATTAQALLGLTVNCARCHDHKFDPISTREYYQFIAAIDGVGFGTRQLTRTADLEQQQRLIRTQQDLESELAKLFASRINTINGSSNVVTLRQPIAANHRDQHYEVSFAVAPTTWADLSQATTSDDAVQILVLRDDQSVLASKTIDPRPWDIQSEDHRFERLSFGYRGDGSGPIRIQIRPQRATTRFAGAVDDLAVRAADGAVIFQDDFDDLNHLHPPGVQATTGKQVFFGSSSLSWEHAGGNAIHVVEIGPGNLALQLYSGEANRTDILAETQPEQSIQRKLQSINDQVAKLSSVTMHTVQAGRPGVMHVRQRGDVTQIGDAVTPAGLSAIVGVPATFEIAADAADANRRTKLADWITHRDNGPFHRVIVNRVWFHHLGSAIVATPNDFGFNGGQPSHPELLDWMAIWFRQGGYSIKNLHRLIVTSETYQQSSLPADNPTRDVAQRLDQSNRLLWRFNPRRADAEYVRDSMLDVAGVLNRRMFGPGFKDVRTDAVGAARYYVAIDPIGEEFNRRTIYRWQARGERSSLLETFDCPDPSTTTPKRGVTTTPTQALSQWNHPFVIRMAQSLADRVENELGRRADVGEKIDRAWRWRWEDCPAPPSGAPRSR